MVDKLPALHLYVQDYLADTRSISNEVKGFYMDLLCYMHKSSRRGFLQQPNGNPYSPEQLGKMTGCSADEASRLLRDLLSSEVISATPKAIPYSRRMVRDEKKRVLCKRAGHLGGNPTLKGQVIPPAYPSPEDENKDLRSSPPEDNSALYRLPVRSQESTALAAQAKHNPPGPLSPKVEFWEPVCRIFGLIPRTQEDDNRLWQQCQDFRLKGATVADLERRAGFYRQRFPNVAFTPRAVLANWDLLNEPPPPPKTFNGRPEPKKSKALHD